MENPTLPVKVKKKLNTLSLTYNDNTLTLEIVDDEIDLILLDLWITDLLMDIHDKAELRKNLLGGKDDSGLFTK
jgi:hypothetical protein